MPLIVVNEKQCFPHLSVKQLSCVALNKFEEYVHFLYFKKWIMYILHSVNYPITQISGYYIKFMSFILLFLCLTFRKMVPIFLLPVSTPEIYKTFSYWEISRSIKISTDMKWSYSQRRNMCIVKWLWHFMTTWYSTVFIFMTIFHGIWNFCNSQLFFIFYLYIVFNSLYVNIVFYIILLIIFCQWFQQEFGNSCICDQIYINIFCNLLR